MLLKLTNEITECYRRAEEARQRAEASTDAATTADYLDMERRWLFLARSYEFSERLTSFTGGRRGGGSES